VKVMCDDNHTRDKIETPMVRMDKHSALWTAPYDCKPTRFELQEPSWTKLGWSEDNPGFVFWFTPQSAGKEGEGPIVRFGDKMLKAATPNKIAKRVYAFAHRYPRKSSFNPAVKIRGALTYHTAILVQWEGDAHMSIIELAWLNGIGGYKGQSNFYHTSSELFQTLRSQAKGMVRPWEEDRHEIRVYDIDAKSVTDFRAFLDTYSEKGIGKDKESRFYDIHGLENKGADVREGGVSQDTIASALLHYNTASKGVYDAGSLNCQTFTADIFRWLTGTDIGPFGAPGMFTGLLMKYTPHDKDWFPTMKSASQ